MIAHLFLPSSLSYLSRDAPPPSRGIYTYSFSLGGGTATKIFLKLGQLGSSAYKEPGDCAETLGFL